MAVAFKDFFPQVTRSGFLSSEYESFQHIVERANAWMASSGVPVLSVETVVLPNVNTEEEALQTNIRTSGEMSSYWRQFLRVWYEVPPAA
ncbi:MAG TPA: hypothetical protein VFV96_07235 [Verrucomicrobiae bacterium]|jgi:hypothetical protein|nr:hypothetical protein [Verrucomicrobiae bacterium]